MFRTTTSRRWYVALFALTFGLLGIAERRMTQLAAHRPIAAATQMLVQASLQQHLSHLIAVQRVQVENLDGTLLVGIDYRLLRDGSERRATVQVAGGGA